MVVVGSKADLEEERTHEAIYPAPWARAHNSKSTCELYDGTRHIVMRNSMLGPLVGIPHLVEW